MQIERYIRIQSDDPIRAALSVSQLLIAEMSGARIVYAIDLGAGQVELLSLHDATALLDALVQVLETQPQPQP